MKKTKIKKNDEVLVVAGKDKGARGRVLRVFPADETAIVERVNFIKRHTRPNPGRQVQGGIVEREAPIHMSNLRVIDPDSGKPTRVGRKRLEDGSGVRIAKVSGSTLN